MKKVLEWLRDYGIVLLVFVLLISSMQTCNTQRQVTKSQKEIKENTVRIDSISKALDDGAYSLPKEELELLIEIGNLQLAKMVLYDQNAIVRTIVRPDDRMNFYDQEISKRVKQLSVIRNQRVK